MARDRRMSSLVDPGREHSLLNVDLASWGCEQFERRSLLAADLIAYGVGVSDTTVDPGQTIIVSWVAKNQGSSATGIYPFGTSQQGVMWSTNSTISRTTDTLLGKEFLGWMGSGTTSFEERAIQVPTSASPGTSYWIGVIMDFDYDISESNEDNNDDAAPVKVTVNVPPKPDLRVTDILMNGSTSLPSVQPGQAVRLDFDNINEGQARAPANVRLNWYWGTTQGSTANYIDYGLLGTINGLGIGETERETDASWSVPSTPGTYWLTAVIDPLGSVDESDESDNVRSESFTVVTLAEVRVYWEGGEITDGQTTPISFGSVLVGSGRPQRTFTVQNVGAVALSTSSLVKPGQYNILEGLSASIAPGGQDTFTLELLTDTVGTFSGGVAFNNSDPDENPFNFPITGIVTTVPPPQEVRVFWDGGEILDGQTMPISFGSVLIGSARPRQIFTVQNVGTASLTTSNLVTSGQYTIAEGLSATIPPGGQDTFTLELLTGTVGIFSGEVRFDNNDLDENPFNFPITGIVSSTGVTGIELTVVDQAGRLWSGLTVYAYGADGSGPLDSRTTDSSGRVIWTGITPRTYRLEVYAGSQYWGSEVLTVESGKTASANFERELPCLVSVRAYNDDGVDVTGRTVAAGSPLTVKVKVKNGVESSVNASAELWLDLSGSSYHLKSDSKALPAGTGYDFSFTFTPAAGGTLYGYPEVWTLIAGRPMLTDSWAFAGLVNVVPTVGPLQTIVRNEAGAPTFNVDVYLYDDQWRLVGHRKTNSQGTVYWMKLPAGSYSVEYYYIPEFWGSKGTSVTAGSSTTVDFVRSMPFVSAVRVFNSLGQDITNKTARSGETLTFEVAARQLGALSRQLFDYFFLRDRGTGEEKYGTKSPTVTIPPVGMQTIRFSFTSSPTYKGLLQGYQEIWTKVGSRDVLTEVWGWRDLVTIV
ncbi:MAG: choice-of-anchor D domain-containing protein [Phycisphaerales bacterium]|nr:choice-of-anchor D domain-containing protein [Phycisphaerales bacterium]